MPINQPEKDNVKVQLSIMRNEMDVLKESRISISSEIRGMIRDKEQLSKEIKQLDSVKEIRLEESRALSLENKESKKNVNTLTNKRDSLTEENSNLQRAISKQKDEQEIINEGNEKRESEISIIEKSTQDKDKQVTIKITELNKVLNKICQ